MRARLFAVNAFVCGVIFALGLGLAGMGTPGKILAFLDVGGRWDPSLAFVMAGAIAVHFSFARRARHQAAPLLDARFVLPSRDAVDLRLVVGAALFGVGWGLQGYCPGPAVLALASLDMTPIAFVAAMIAGLVVTSRVQERRDHDRRSEGADDGSRASPNAGSITPSFPRA
jgi:uncharacterized membrane protein YedE/YeeE